MLLPQSQTTDQPADEICSAGKIVLGRQADVALLDQICPPVLAPVPVDHIEVLHRVVGTIGGQRSMTERDRADLGLIAGTAKGWEGRSPIDPDWEPLLRRSGDNEPR